MDKKAEMRKKIAERKAKQKEESQSKETEAREAPDESEQGSKGNGETEKTNDDIDNFLTPQVASGKDLAAVRIQAIARGNISRKKTARYAEEEATKKIKPKKKRPRKASAAPSPPTPALPAPAIPTMPRPPAGPPPPVLAAKAPAQQNAAPPYAGETGDAEVRKLRKQLAETAVALKRTKRELHDSSVKNEGLFKEFTSQMQKLREKADAATTELSQEFDVLAQELAGAKRALAHKDAERDRMHQMRVEQEAEIQRLTQELQIALRDAHRFSALEHQTRSDVEELHRLMVHFGVNNIQELEYKIQVAEEGWQMGNIEIERLRNELEYNSGASIDMKSAYNNLETDIKDLQARKWKADGKIMKLEQQLEGATMDLAKKERELEGVQHRMNQLLAQQKTQFQHLLAAHHGHGGPASYNHAVNFNQMPPPVSLSLLKNKMQFMEQRERQAGMRMLNSRERQPLPPLNGALPEPSPRAQNFVQQDFPSPSRRLVEDEKRKVQEKLRALHHQKLMHAKEFTPKAAAARRKKKSPVRRPRGGYAKNGAADGDAEEMPRWK